MFCGQAIRLCSASHFDSPGKNTSFWRVQYVPLTTNYIQHGSRLGKTLHCGRPGEQDHEGGRFTRGRHDEVPRDYVCGVLTA